MCQENPISKKSLYTEANKRATYKWRASNLEAVYKINARWLDKNREREYERLRQLQYRNYHYKRSINIDVEWKRLRMMLI